ncbi:MAG TPA: hypothetical protein VGB13_02730 [Candidatus Krumholzibacteria bacterium]|jgi:hypothetical protein
MAFENLPHFGAGENLLRGGGGGSLFVLEEASGWKLVAVHGAAR